MLKTIKINLKAVSTVFRLVRFTSGPVSYRLKVVQKYYPFYIYHIRHQQAQFNQNLKHLQQQRQQNAYGNKIKSFYNKYSQKLKTQISTKAQQLQQKDKSQYEKQARNLLHQGMQYLSLYYESLQNLIQGRRQVLHDQNFKFQDGQTVDQKRIRFQKYLSKLLGRKKQEMERLQEEYERKKEAQRQRQNL